MVYLTRRERFSAAHRLYNPEWTDESNSGIYGGCANPNWHGHNYELLVTVKGEVKSDYGYLVDLRTLSEIIREQIITKLDHKNMNLEVDFLKDKMTSTENLAMAIWDQLYPHIKKLGIELHCVHLRETENNYAEYYGEK